MVREPCFQSCLTQVFELARPLASQMPNGLGSSATSARLFEIPDNTNNLHPPLLYTDTYLARPFASFYRRPASIIWWWNGARGARMWECGVIRLHSWMVSQCPALLLLWGGGLIWFGTTLSLQSCSATPEKIGALSETKWSIFGSMDRRECFLHMDFR